MMKFKEYYDDFNELLIDSDGTRDIKEITKFIKKEKVL